VELIEKQGGQFFRQEFGRKKVEQFIPAHFFQHSHQQLVPGPKTSPEPFTFDNGKQILNWDIIIPVDALQAAILLRGDFAAGLPSRGFSHLF